MDRARRAEPYSNATIWTREIARNLAGHLSRVSKAHSCVDTKSPKSTRLPQFHHTQKRCPTSPIKTRQPFLAIARESDGEHELDFRGLGGGSAREESESTPMSIQKPATDYFHHSHGKQAFVKKKVKSISVKSQVKSDDTSIDLVANQEVSDRPAQIPAVKLPTKQHPGNDNGNGNAITTYNSPLILPHHRDRLAHDYSRRQEQIKIWQENQALIKRLQTTKATLNSKEWKKDGKWTQEYLKKQERRRSVLQQEMRRAQVSPQAVLRSKPLKSLQPHHLKNIHQESLSEKNLRASCLPTKTDVPGAHSAREPMRRRSRGQVTRRISDTVAQQATAANHRRVMELRKQKSLHTTTETTTQLTVTAAMAEENALPAAEVSGTFISDNEIVNVRFTFSRGRNRGGDSSKQQLDKVEALDIDRGERDMMSLSGAFSPGVELESALNAAAVGDGVRIGTPKDVQHAEHVCSCDNKHVVGEATSEQFETKIELEAVVDSSSRGNNPVSSIAESEPPRAAPDYAVVATGTKDENNIESSTLIASQQAPYLSEENSFTEHQQNEQDQAVYKQLDVAAPSTETAEVRSGPNEESFGANEAAEEEERYDGDDFDRDVDPVTPEVKDKDEASGYGSEFEEDIPVESVQAAPEFTADNQQGDEEAEVSYSHDEFID